MAATWHMVAATGLRRPLEDQAELLPAVTPLIDTPLQVTAGAAQLPSAPGLGITVNEELVRSSATTSCAVRG